jgi:hypothetical protein
MNCYFCNKIIYNAFIDEYHCYDCNCTVISGDAKSVLLIYLYYKEYYFYLDFYNDYYALYYRNNYKRSFYIYKFDNLPNITPRNIESKINTILAFL